ncbi:unnamed protein product [Didymodactylos carnosus]|uniref:AB hydrolase-1 domain-containing protein n=1 Tax=Didymodactylos carnosus TaxID=1234261 RepID=A0A8S2MY86_9BILA|nr:unnamed protein product [Didymodactylos carnosus]CAF3967336.1 unnamed protein product [Didymodactylos carnosus]
MVSKSIINMNGMPIKKEKSLTTFIDRPLLDGLIDVYHSSPFKSILSFILISLISAIIPLSFLWVVLVILQSICHLFTIPVGLFFQFILTLWAITEIIFLFYQYYLSILIQRPARMPTFSQAERDSLISSTLVNMKDVRGFLSKWFMSSAFEQISHTHIQSWMAYAFYGKDEKTLNDDELNTVDTLLKRLKKDYEIEVVQENREQLKCMKHILDPVCIIFRPFVYYVATDTICNSLLATSAFYLMNYKYYTVGSLSFWMYTDPNEDKRKPPIIFFHGIGAGLLMYIPFFRRIHREHHQGRRIILISLRCICMRYPTLSDIPDMNETIASVHEIFQYFQFKKAIFIGHSYGTACLSWITKNCPEYVSKLIFIDPICFELFEPYVIFNFVYRKPYRLGHLYMYYFVCRELGISHVISRHFWWFQNILFAEQLPTNIQTKVFLSGRDCIVNVHLVKDYLNENRIDFHWAPKLSHGGYMQDKHSWDKIAEWI